MPALDRLAVRQISVRYLSQDERIEIAELRQAGLSVRQIAVKLDRAPSTVSRELRRNGRRDGAYRPFEAHRWSIHRRARGHRRRIRCGRVVIIAALTSAGPDVGRGSPNRRCRSISAPLIPLTAAFLATGKEI